MKRTELKRRGRRRQPGGQLSERTMSIVRSRQGGLCVCGCRRRISPAPIGYHHVFAKQRWPELVDAPDNIVGVFADCHANHETGMTRLPPVAATKRAARLATTPAMEAYLARIYR